jgi:diguanylate cyclase (GGDEF)-like protein/PAS domain S-box-containing protein
MTNKKTLHRILQKLSTAWVVLIIALVATIWGSLIVNQVEQEQIKQNVFDYRVERIKMLIKNRITAYQQILHSGVGLFAASETVNRQEWHRFVEHLSLNKRYSGIQGVGFSKLISPQDKETHIQEIQSEGGFFLDYDIKPEGNREQYTSIVYLEPMDRRNQQAIGFDMFSEPVRRIAMERARDTGEAALSGKVTLVQEIDENKQAGFLIYVPVYRKGVPLNTIEEKRAALLGYVYSPFRMNDFMKGLFGDKPSGIDIHIYDGDVKQNPTAMQLMYDEMSDNSSYQPHFYDVKTLEIAGHVWTIYFYSLPLFETTTKTYTYKIVLLGGILLSILLFGFTRSFETAHLLEKEHKLNKLLEIEIDERKKIEADLKELNRDFVTLLNNTTDFIYFKDQESRMHFCSQTLAKITGHQYWKEMKGKHDFEIFPKDTAQIYYEEELPIFSGEKTFIDTINPYYDAEGKIGWVHTNKWAVFGENDNIVGIFGISRDITDRKRMEIELSEAKQLSDKIINSLPGIFYMLDQQGNFIRWNSNFKEIASYSDEEMLGKYVLDFIAEQDRDLITTRIQEVFEKGESFAEAHLLTKQGKSIPYYFTGCRILLQDQFYLIGLGQDITNRKKMEEELWRLANTDFLTGLMSRRYFMKKIEEEFILLCNHDINCCSILMLDLDHFKYINDTYGHAVGDTVLKHFSALLQSNLRQMDVAGRLGGEEFAVILPYIDANEAKQCAERLRNIVANSPIIENDNVISITVSIGISMLRENDRYADTALIRADNALFAAKNNGRNTIQIAA